MHNQQSRGTRQPRLVGVFHLHPFQELHERTTITSITNPEIALRRLSPQPECHPIQSALINCLNRLSGCVFPRFLQTLLQIRIITDPQIISVVRCETTSYPDDILKNGTIIVCISVLSSKRVKSPVWEQGRVQISKEPRQKLHLRTMHENPVMTKGLEPENTYLG